MLANTEVEFLGPKQRKKVVIIGRPNVGKSSLFNALVGGRPALVKDEPGVTRDFNIRSVDIWGKTFDLIDTGGVTDTLVPLAQEIRDRVLGILPQVDLILFVVDGRTGPVFDDKEILIEIQKSKKPFIMLVNKMDSAKDEASRLGEFFELGVDMIPTAFESRRGLDQVCEWLVHNLEGPQNLEAPLEKKIAIIGRPNVGKSSLINYLLNEERMLVSEVAGTTVDAIDSEINWQGKKYIFIDTAGLRRAARRDTDIEILSAFKSQEALSRALIVVLMVDGIAGISQQEARLLDLVLEQKKAAVVAINKSDLGPQNIENYREKLREQIETEFHFHKEIPRVFISAKTGQGMDRLFSVIDELWEKMHIKISTSELNEFMGKLTQLVPPPIYGSRPVKLNYFTQTQQMPPHFIAFCNFPKGVSPAYQKFLINEIRKKWSLFGVPISLSVLKKN